MKRILIVGFLSITFVVAAQVTTNETPVLTNNVQYVWAQPTKDVLVRLWNADYNVRMNNYILATNADASFALSNAVPTKAVFAVWAATFFKDRALAEVAQAERQRVWDAQQAVNAQYPLDAELFKNAYPNLTPVDRKKIVDLLTPVAP